MAVSAVALETETKTETKTKDDAAPVADAAPVMDVTSVAVDAEAIVAESEAATPELAAANAEPVLATIAAPADAATDVTAAVEQADANQAVADKIDAVMNKAGGDTPEVAATQNEMPNNYRPPPKQNQKPRERRERPNIFDHGLLKSMDLSFVGGDLANPRSRGGGSNPKPKHGSPIGYLSQGGAGFVQNRLGG